MASKTCLHSKKHKEEEEENYTGRDVFLLVLQSESKAHKNSFFDLFSIYLKCEIVIFNSPEPKAQGELIVWDSSLRPSVCPSVRPSLHNFKHEYL